jgi:predicted ABC-type ATPase
LRRTDLKNKKYATLLVIMLSIMVISGCKKEEQTLYNRNIVVDGIVLPFYESSLTYNAEDEGQMRSKLSSIWNDTIANLPGTEEYIIVNHNGEDLTQEFLVEKSPSHQEMQDMIKKVKENGYLIVRKNYYRVTTIEKEMKALFAGERIAIRPEIMDKVIKDNREAYENKDYESINLYLRKNDIKNYDKLKLQP